MATVEMCKHCFDVLVARLSGQPIPLFASTARFPLFVTWKKDAGGEEPDLRGCIGTFSPVSLSQQLGDFALKSALKDTRFDPIDASELPSLHVGVSLLTDFEDAASAFDWTPGKHGIIIDFQHRGQDLSATFLPEVATEQGWDRDTTLRHLIAKAGHRGRVDDSFFDKLRVTRYQSDKAWLSYAAYAGQGK